MREREAALEKKSKDMSSWGKPTCQTEQGGRTVLRNGRASTGISRQQNRNTEMIQGGSYKRSPEAGLDSVESMK